MKGNLYRQFVNRKEAVFCTCKFIRNMKSKYFYQIRDVENHAVWIVPRFNNKNRITFRELFKEFEFEDCSPCGVRKGDQNGTSSV